MSPFVGRSLLAARRPLALLAAVAALALGCGRTEPKPAPVAAVAAAPTATAATARAAYIASVQRKAGPRYHARADGTDTWLARSPGFVSRFTADGVSVEVRRPHGLAVATGPASTTWRLRLARFGCGEDLAPVAPATPTASGNRVEYDRTQPGHALTEWYLNGPLGLEQGFTVAQAPDCTSEAGRLRLELDTAGELTPVLTATADAVELRDAARRVALRYSDLHATDASGRVLAARMALAGAVLALEVDAAGASYPVTIDPIVSVEQQKLLASDGSANQVFGTAVAISGDTGVVGAPTPGTATTDAAYVFVRSGSTWSEQQKIPSVATQEAFGKAVAVENDTLLVGGVVPHCADPPECTIVNNGFMAWAYTRTAGTWSLQGALDPGAPLVTNFGAVALSGDTALVSTKAVGPGGTASVFVRASGVWSVQQSLAAYGTGAALDGDTAAVGSSGIQKVFVYTRSGTTWTEQQQVTPSDGAGGDLFGSTIALRGNVLVVGSPGHDELGSSAGAAYVFVRSGTTWTETQKLLASDGAALDQFGSSVAIDTDYIVIGAPYDDDGANATGSAYVFVNNGSSWVQGPKLLAADAQTGDNFGCAVAVSGSTVLVGASADDDRATDAGAAYVFRVGRASGDSCSDFPDGSKCATGFCRDGVCCNEACTGTCRSCNLPSNVGTCSNVARYDPDSDTGCTAATNQTCDGDGNCKKMKGQACVSGGECASTICVDNTCCADPCTTTCFSCATAAGECTGLVAQGAADTNASPACSGTQACDGSGHCKLKNGQGCTNLDGSECASGFCVDGRCCENACTAACLSCVTSGGTCTGLVGQGTEDPNAIPACTGTQACDGSGACKKRNGQGCDGGGECVTGKCVDGTCCEDDCTITCKSCANSQGKCITDVARGTEDSGCTGTQACDGSGACKLKDGQVCNSALNGADCASGFCADGFCCNTACGANCDACAAALKPSGANGVCGVALAGWAGNPACGPYLCDGSATTCPVSCASDAGCSSGYYCDATGHCQNRRPQGDPCDAHAGVDCLVAGCRVCTTGHCVDSKCCEDACTATCKSCGNTGGTCTTDVGQGTEDPNGSPTCTGTQACDGAGGCKKKNGQTCGGGGECASGKCVDGRCCANDCTTTCHSCANDQGTCTTAVTKGVEDPNASPACTGTQACDGAGGCKRKNGEPCSDGPGDCVSGFCVDGVCCASECTEPCRACRADLKASGADSGLCDLAAAGKDPHGNCEAEAQSTCGQNGMCAGNGSCQLWGYGTSCDAATYCDGNTVRGRICTGSGGCIDNPSGIDCSPYVCQGTGCKNPCQDDSHCTTGSWCNAGVCTPKQANGAECTAGNQCTSTFCVDGVCCDTLCNGLCQACAAGLKASGADNGVCGNGAAGMDPHDQCPDDGPASCDRNGTCDGAGQCAIYPIGFECKLPRCDQGARVTSACDGAGTCVETPTDCAPFACDTGVCASTCSGDDDCDADAFCDGSTCTAKWTNGTPCTEGRTCAKGWCIDGVCCATACTGQCEACDVEGLAGTCAPVNGDPHGDRDPCPGATGGDPCTGRACRGGTDPTQCVGWAGIDVPCREASCVDGLETRSATCDGGGHCSNPDTKECQPYVCRGDACGAEPCGGDTDCVAEFRCDPATHKCVPRDMATCDGDHTVTAPDGTTQTDCSPYVCEVGENGGVCKDSCTATTDCVGGYVCDTLQGQGVCVAAGGGGGGNQGGGCAVAGSAAAGVTHAGLLSLWLLLGRWRHSVRAGRRPPLATGRRRRHADA